MRQVGVLAACCLIALEESPKLLHQDHANAKRLAEGIAETRGLAIDPASVQTNIVIFDVAKASLSANEICAELKNRGVLASGFGNAIRMVTHYDVSRTDIDRALITLRQVVSENSHAAALNG